MKEVKRQYVHIMLSIILILVLHFFGITRTIILLFFGIIIGSFIINQKLQHKQLPIIDKLVDMFERKNARFIGYGSAWFAIGCLISITFLNDINSVIAIVWALGIGDGLSTLIGMRGKIKLPYNNKKTFEGTLAMFLSVLPMYFVVGELGIILAILASIGESLPLPIDDNVTIPIIGVILFSIL